MDGCTRRTERDPTPFFKENDIGSLKNVSEDPLLKKAPY
jgi:hypothetical protein